MLKGILSEMLRAMLGEMLRELLKEMLRERYRFRDVEIDGKMLKTMLKYWERS